MSSGRRVVPRRRTAQDLAGKGAAKLTFPSPSLMTAAPSDASSP